ncbi:hypothetical protein FACS1894163_00620 [Spirochaetia bacterium]|nr:hypothetical protein FACS1894163_00620 [Spirochaetia bacterium]
MISTNELLSNIVTFQKYAFSKELKTIKIYDFLESIRSEAHNEFIKKLRKYLADNDKKRYDQEKIRLPSVSFSGFFFNKRTLETISNYNGLCIIDIDHVSEEKSQEIFNYFKSDPYVFSYWRSPSGNGIKGLVKFKYLMVPETSQDYEYHKHAFSTLSAYMKNAYNIDIDKSGNDITRLCFVSSDKNIVLKKEAEEFEFNTQFIVPESPIQRRQRNRSKSSIFILREHLYPIGRNKSKHREQIAKFIKYLKKKNLSITNTYEKWYRVAYAIANTFTYDIGEKYFLQLCRLDGTRHDEEKSKEMLQYCYVNSKKSISFGTIQFYFKELWGSRTEEVSS